MADAFAVTTRFSASFFPEVVSFGPYVSWGTVYLPNGEIDSIVSVGGQLGLGVGLPYVEGGVQMTVLGKGLDGISLPGWGGNQFKEIWAGGLTLDSRVSQWVQAMASYSATHQGFDPISSGNTAAPN